jgi:diguanylate cyclase (GGDEF)-like protein/PAS domain S-box-containing protein
MNRPIVCHNPAASHQRSPFILGTALLTAIGLICTTSTPFLLDSVYQLKSTTPNFISGNRVFPPGLVNIYNQPSLLFKFGRLYVLSGWLQYAPTAPSSLWSQVRLLRAGIPKMTSQQPMVSWRYFYLSLLILSMLFGTVIWLLLKRLGHYIAECDRLQQDLFQEKELTQITFHAIGDGVITTDARGRIELFNPVAEKLTGWRSAEVQGLFLTEVITIINEMTREPIENPVTNVLQPERKITMPTSHHLLIARGGEEFAIDDSVAPIRSRHGEIVGAVLVLRNVTQARHIVRQLSWQTSYDALTGLANRREFESRLEQALDFAKIQHQQHSLCFLDLDRFKSINDTYGHIAGDELLRQFSALLQQNVRKTDMIARLGGDEFGIILYQCPLSQAQYLAQTLCTKVQEFGFIWQNSVFSIGVSIGLVEINAKSVNLTEVWQAADSACYGAKQAGRGQVQIYRGGDEDIAQ